MKIASLLVLALLGFVPARAHAQTVSFEDFEAGFGNWTASGLWHAESASSTCGASSAPFPSGSNCAWYGGLHGSACDFDTGAQNGGAFAMATPLALAPAPGQEVWLRYENIIATEGCLPDENRDRARVQVSANGGQTWVDVANECRGNQPNFLAWHKGRALLSSFAGGDVLVRFAFDSVDASLNATKGWWIDDVEIRYEAGRPTCDAESGCPCGNFNSNSQNPESPFNANIGGCYHSFDLQAELKSSGTPSIGADDVQLVASEFSGRVVVFRVGQNFASPVVFGDGVSCLGSSTFLAITVATAGHAVFPGPGDPRLSSFGAVAGQLRTYQAFYRNAAAYCTPGTANATNAYEIGWRL